MAPQARAAVVADAVSSQSAPTGSTALSFNHVLGTGPARLVVCTVAIANPTAAVANVTPAVTFAGFPMNAIAASQAPGAGQNTSKIESEMFYLNDTTLGTTSGSVAVNVTLPGAAPSGGVVAGCSSFFGLAQAAPETAGNTYQGSGTPAASITLMTATAGDLIVDSFGGGYTASTTGKTASPGTGQTQLYTTQLSTGGILNGSSYEIAGAAGAATVTWNETVSRQAYSAVAFQPTPITYYTVATSVNPAGTGSIALSPSASNYAAGSTVQVTATPAANYTFTGFTGDLSGTTNPAQLTVNSNKSVIANFAIAQCTLTVVSGGHGTVSGSGTFNCGSTVTISATPDAGYAFGQFSGSGYSGTANPATFTLSASTTETASFVAGTTCTLTTTVTGSGAIALNPAGGAYSCGTSVTVTATPSTADYTFSGFSGALTGTANPQTLVLNANSSVNAAFTQTSFPVNVTVVGQGTVAANPSQASYAQGSQVTLTATPAAGYHFNGFTGDVTSTTSPVTVTVNATKNITATFAASVLTQDAVGHGVTTGPASTLSWTHVLGAGSNRLIVVEIGFVDAAASPDANAVVQSVLFNGVYATAVPNSLIYGGTSGMVQSQLFYLTDSELPPAGTYTVQVNLAGTIAGFQAGSISYFGASQGPAEAVVTHRDTTGADLISTSITTLTPNAVVVDQVEDNNLAPLTANAGQTVAWTQSSTGSGSGGASTKVVATPGSTTLGWAGSASRLTHSLAAFAPAGDTAPPTYTLTVNTTPGGTVSSNPNLTQLPTGTGVLLTATAQTGYTFSGWTGDFTSTSNPLAIVMDMNHTVTANFTSVATCTLAENIIGSGTVTPAPGTYNCGTVIHFVATPAAGYNFASYSGDFTSSDNPADYTLATNSSVTIEFDQAPQCSLTLNTVGQGTLSAASGAYACGTIFNLQATAAAGYAFAGYSGDLTATNNPTSFILDANKSITATFTSGAGCTLTTAVVGNGSISPGSGTYACGTTLSVSALPQSHYLFSGFSGDLTGTTSPQPLTLNANKSVTATFAYNTAGVTGDARTVTQPVYPSVCSVLKATQLLTAPNESAPDTTRIQAALNACPVGQAVEFTSDSGYNAFIIAPLTLPPGVTMLVDADVTLLGSIKYADYNCVIADSFCSSLITVAANSDPNPGSAIMGLGVIDGRANIKLTDKSTNFWAIDVRPRMIYLGTRAGSVPADNFTVYQITLKNPAKFHISGPGSNLTVWGIRILTPSDSPNTDGIDPSGSKNITVTNSYVSDGDDMVAVKAGIGHVSNVTVSNSHFYSGHGVSVGSETNGGLNNMLVMGNAFDNGFGGSSLDSLRIKSDVSRGGEVYDVLYKNTCIQHGGDTLVFDPYYASRSGSLIPNFHDITISNFHELIRDSGHKCTIQGYNTSGTVYPLGLTLDNVVFDGATLNDFKAPDQINNANITVGPGPVNILPFLQTGASVASNNITITNNISNSNPALDCTNAFVYLTGELAPVKGNILAGSSPIIMAMLQNVVAPLSAGTISFPQQNAPTGTINLLEGTTVVGSATINGRIASISVANIAAGTHTYTAQYLGDSHYSTPFSFGTLTVTAGAAVTPPVANNQTVSTANGAPLNITLTGSGNGTLTYVIVTQPAHGSLAGAAPSVTYTPTAGYSGGDSFTFKINNGADSNIATVTIGVGTPATTLSLATPSPSSGLSTGQSTTLTATLTPVASGGFTATGGITFSDGGTALCTAVPFNASGIAQCLTPGLTAGTHTFTANYAGDTHFMGSTSNQQSVTVAVPLSALTVSGFPASAHIGRAYSITVTARDGSNAVITNFSGTVTVSSSDAAATLPAPYSFTPADGGMHTFLVTLNTGGTQTITATSGAVSGSQTGIVVDDYIWVVSGTGTLGRLDETGTAVNSNIGTAGTNSAFAAIAFDAAGTVWSVSSANNSLSATPNIGGTPVLYTGGGINSPASVAVDGNGFIWVANRNNTLSVFNNSGTVQSPAGGLQSATANKPSTLNVPSGLAIDNSGSVWITDSANGTVTKVFGAAAPVVSPTATAVTNNKLGAKP